MGRMRIRLIAAAVVLAAAVIALTTCSNPIDLVEAATVEVMKANDRYLEVVSTTPVNGDDEVNPGTRIKIRFDRDINPDTVNSLSVRIIKVSDSSETLWTPLYDSNTRTLAIRPNSLLSDTADYSVIVNGVRGADGSSMLENVSWQFHTVVAPTGQVSVESSDANSLVGYANSWPVIVSIVSPSGGADQFTVAATEAALSNPELIPSGSWKNIATESFNFSSSTTQGMHSIYVVLRDSTKVSAYSSILDNSIIYDSEAPSVGTWKINSDAVYATSPTVTLAPTIAPSDLTSGVSRMQFSNNGSNWSSWEPYVSTKTWNITDAAYGGNAISGTKTAHIRVMDKAGKISTSSTDSIVYDSTPTIGAPNVTSVENITLDQTPTWTWTSGDPDGTDTYQYQINSTTGSWTTVTGVTTYTPSSSLADGLYRLYVQQRDVNYDYYSLPGSYQVRVTVVIPYNGASGVSRTPTLSWRTPLFFLGTYAVQVEDGRFWTTVVSGLSTNSYTLPVALDPLSTYTWRIAATNKGITSFIPSEAGASFTTRK